jgi:hypothetical protein
MRRILLATAIGGSVISLLAWTDIYQRIDERLATHQPAVQPATSVTKQNPSEGGERSCLAQLSAYGDKFSVKKLGKNPIRKTSAAPYENDPAVMLYWTQYTVGVNAMTTQKSSNRSEEWVTQLSLRDAEDLPCDLKTRMNAEQLIKRIGQPVERDNRKLVYRHPPDVASNQIEVLLEEGKVEAIQWLFSQF